MVAAVASTLSIPSKTHLASCLPSDGMPVGMYGMCYSFHLEQLLLTGFTRHVMCRASVALTYYRAAAWACARFL